MLTQFPAVKCADDSVKFVSAGLLPNFQGMKTRRTDVMYPSSWF